VLQWPKLSSRLTCSLRASAACGEGIGASRQRVAGIQALGLRRLIVSLTFLSHSVLESSRLCWMRSEIKSAVSPVTAWLPSDCR
jgi:hypothetical protein